VALVVESQTRCRVVADGQFVGDAGRQVVLLELAVRKPEHAPLVERCAVTGVALKGELCPYTIGEVRPVLADLALGTFDLVFDLAEVTFLGAAALRLFTEVDQVLRGRGGRLLLQDPTPLALRVIEICHMERMLMSGMASREVSAARLALSTEPALKVRDVDHGQTIEVTVTVAAPCTPARLVDLQRKLVHLIGVRQPSELRLCAHTSNRTPIPPDSWREAGDALASIGGRLTLVDGDGPA